MLVAFAVLNNMQETHHRFPRPILLLTTIHFHGPKQHQYCIESNMKF